MIRTMMEDIGSNSMMTTNTTNNDSYDDYMDAYKRHELWAKEEAKDDRQLDNN